MVNDPPALELRRTSPQPRYAASGRVLVRPEVLGRLAEVDTLIFDIDGVIMDVTGSMRAVGCDAVRAYLTEIVGWPDRGPLLDTCEIELYKLADGFNDDWELAGVNVLTFLVKAELTGTQDAATLRAASPTVAELATAARTSRGGPSGVRALLLERLDEAARARVMRAWDFDKIRQIFQELYAGEDYCPRFYGYHPQHLHVPGRIALDRPLIRRASLPPAVTKLGIYSGRTWQETRAALEMAGIADLFARERVMVVDDGMVKPDPRGLATLVERMAATAAVFVGDMPDDREAVRRYREIRGAGVEVFDCLVLSGPLGGRPQAEIRAAGADLIAPDVNVFMEWWAERAGAPFV
jgi:HAD superfamily hydrolase (TIGR01548 family)